MAAIVLGGQLCPQMPSWLSGPSRADATHAPVEGFGAATKGGEGKPECVVTSLADSGPGTLRECLSGGNRRVVFSIAGTIHLASQLFVQGSFVTIDGFSAPSPGITLHGFGINIWDQHDVILRGFRIRKAGGGVSGSKSSIDCLTMNGSGVFNIVVDHLSIFDCADGGIDISSGPSSITIQWSIVSTAKPMVWGSTSSSVAKDTDRISMHHTALICGPDPIGCDRFPLIRASGWVTTADIRYNIFEGWIRANGTKIEPAAWVNVIGNAYIPRADSTYDQRDDSIAVNPGTRVYTADNIELGALPRPNLNDNGNESQPMPAPAITERDLGCVIRDAGAHPRDETDKHLMTYVTVVPAGCSGSSTPPPPPPTATLPDLVSRVVSAPSTVTAGQTVSISATIANEGMAAAPATSARLYLSVDRTVNSGDVALGSIAVPSLAAGATHTGTTSVTLPAATAGGAYNLLVRADDGTTVAESSEQNNTVSLPISVTAAAPSSPFATLLEAESMTLTSGMSIGSDSGALGGRYVSPTSGSNSTSPVREASIGVSVPTTGTYYLWARMYAPSTSADALYLGIDSSWDRVYPSTQGSYQWVRIETANGSGGFGFQLTSGTHTIQVARGEVNTRLDAVYLTNRATDVPAFTPLTATFVPLVIQAESMALTSGMTVASDSGALGGRYVSPTSGSNSTSPVREASASVSIPKAGTYYLWARMYGPSPSADALYFGINASWDRVYPSTQGSYQWVRIETTNGSGTFGFQLAPGTHTIQLGRGELNTRLDAVYLTNSATDVPAFKP